jgi:hypothetical protein
MPRKLAVVWESWIWNWAWAVTVMVRAAARAIVRIGGRIAGVDRGLSLWRYEQNADSSPSIALRVRVTVLVGGKCFAHRKGQYFGTSKGKFLHS